VLTFPAGDPNYGVHVFRGDEPQGQLFACLPQSEWSGTGLQANGAFGPTGLPTWNNCQVRVASKPSDQVFLAFTLPDTSNGTTTTTTTTTTLADTTPPTINSFTPAEGALVHGTAVAVTGAATDAGSGVKSMAFTIDNGSVIGQVVDMTAPYGFTLNSKLLPDGHHTINVTATDNSDNTTTVQTHNFTVDNTAPTTPRFTKALAPFTTATTAALTFSSTDATSGVASYKVQFERVNFNATVFSAWATAPNGGALNRTSYTMAGLAAGYDYCFRVISTDKAGNVSAPSSLTCTARLIDDKALVHSAGWVQRVAAGYYSNTYSQAGSANRTLTLANFRGDRLAIMALECPTCGSIRVYVGATLIRAISLAATKRTDALIVLPPFGQRAGTIKILTLSTKPVVIDGIGASRT